MEIIIIALVILAVGAIWYFNRDKGLDVNADGKVDIEDAKAAVENTVEAVKETVEEKVKAKKPARAKKASADFDSMKKDDLLAHAKKVGAKANASMKKADIIKAIKNAG